MKGLVWYNWFGDAELLKPDFVYRAVHVQIKIFCLHGGIFTWTLGKVQYQAVSVVTCLKMTSEVAWLFLHVLTWLLVVISKKLFLNIHNLNDMRIEENCIQTLI